MDTSNSADLADSSGDLFEDLRKYEINIPDHLVNLLLKMGFTTVQALARLTVVTFEAIEDTVRNLFAKLYKGLPLEERSSLFGIFSNSIELFQILPGERAQIIAAVEYAKKVVVGYDELLLKAIHENRGGEPAWPAVNFSDTEQLMCSPSNTASDTGNRSHTLTDDLKPNKTIAEQVYRWVSKNQKDIFFTHDSYIVEEERMKVRCTLCKPPRVTKIYADHRNKLKISNFTRHVLHFHCRDPCNRPRKGSKLKKSQMITAKTKTSDGGPAPEEPRAPVTQVEAPGSTITDTPASEARDLSHLLLAYNYGTQYKTDVPQHNK